MSDTEQGLLAGRYRLVSLLGEGGMGRVWEARDELLGRDVAIKEISPDGLSAAELGDLRERAIREARAIAKVSHRNVVRIFDVFDHEGAPWIVMELIRSRSLLDVVNEEGPMQPERAAHIGLEVLGALQAAHRAGILHRDVKPANVLLAHDGRVVLTDFGLASVAGDSGMTRTGVVLGSPSYLAPERALDEPARPGSDLWSLGATLFAAVEGRPPYVKSSPMATLASLMVDPAPVPQRAGVLRPALEALLQKDPSDRVYADEAEQLLRAAANSVPAAAQPRQQQPRIVETPKTSEKPKAPAPYAQTPPNSAQNAAPPTRPTQAGGPHAPAGGPPTPAPRPAQTPPAQGGTPPPTPGKPRRGLIVSVVIAIVLAVAIAVVLFIRGSQDPDAAAATEATTLTDTNTTPGLEWSAPAPPAAASAGAKPSVSAKPTKTPSRSTTPSTPTRSLATKAPVPPKATKTTPPVVHVTFEGESYTINNGTENSFPSTASGGQTVGHTGTGDWVGYANRSLAGVHNVGFRCTAGKGGTSVQIRANSATGPLLGTAFIPETPDFDTFENVATKLSATSSGPLYIVFLGPQAADIDTVTLSS
ncbi:protein kinase [Actinoplanes sp. TBRC 11911]|uniref:protein kinase domain-containing protein n=1 Tax=Actinoplanes sp. TBRC 11911 TaxID=2729386 RepID=UPI00145E39F5|nr:protein kinase [Actinoplanes sp. TBRC 11911]NMO49714.1 protein kinase [Actinoplanes sp. TBRC 11911]